MHYNLIIILGPTAVGKTKLGAAIAYKLNGEIISADSRQVYRGMDIGTGKDLKDYIVNGYSIPCHLIDIIDPSKEYNLFEFQKNFYYAFNKIKSSGKIPLLVGGTGLYIDSIIKNYDMPESIYDRNGYNDLEKFTTDELQNMLLSLKSDQHNTTDLIDKDRLIKAILIAKSGISKNNKKKTDIVPIIIGIREKREVVKERITKRLKERLNSGMVEEVKKLIDNGITYEKLNFFGLEYKYIGQYLSGALNYNDLYQKLNSAIHDFAKRQMTWFRKMEREGTLINWIEGASVEQAVSIINQHTYLDE